MQLRLPGILIILLSSIGLAQSASPLEGWVDLQCHRGGRGLNPEHTIPSFRSCLKHNMTTIELDSAGNYRYSSSMSASLSTVDSSGNWSGDSNAQNGDGERGRYYTIGTNLFLLSNECTTCCL